jgi:magnesium-transporting ATPase (P-type)
MQANTAWYITLILCQFWHIWFCKTRRVSIFKHSGLLENRITMYGVVAALAIMFVCAYVPWLQEEVFKSAAPPSLATWIPHLFFLAFVLVYTEATKAHARRTPNSWFTRTFVW